MTLLQYAYADPRIESSKPTIGSIGSAGIDLRATSSALLWPGFPKKVATNLRFVIPTRHVGVVKDRSSMALRGLHVLGGVIDSDYRGEVAVILVNVGWIPRWVCAGDRIAQMLVLPYALCSLALVRGRLDETVRGSRGFGSTGR